MRVASSSCGRAIAAAGLALLLVVLLSARLTAGAVDDQETSSAVTVVADAATAFELDLLPSFSQHVWMQGPLAPTGRQLRPLTWVNRSVAAVEGLDTRGWLNVSFVALQALDVHSTLHALHEGGHEANPVLQGMSGSPIALLAVKAGVATLVIVLAKRLEKTNPRAAKYLMIAENALYGVIITHNYAITRQQ